jgi:hypothetical protein
MMHRMFSNRPLMAGFTAGVAGLAVTVAAVGVEFLGFHFAEAAEGAAFGTVHGAAFCAACLFGLVCAPLPLCAAARIVR